MSFLNQECHRPKPGHRENFVKNVSIATKNTRSTGITNVIFSVICQVYFRRNNILLISNCMINCTQALDWVDLNLVI